MPRSSRSSFSNKTRIVFSSIFSILMGQRPFLLGYLNSLHSILLFALPYQYRTQHSSIKPFPFKKR
ncbi:hypothetical protein LSAJ156_370012 [Latilactobacillus sakei]|nr:hypothetical protein LSAJ160_210035 [Latilactobacillus sakei]SOB39924.1 hypothetical protein LSAJ156_370012 [Latilactobacillus sakei]SON73750.1 protein of unknown function [Latilactobacillus sakei]